MRLSPDQIILWQHAFMKLNETIAFTWAIMFVLAVGSRLVTRKLSSGATRSRWQNVVEILVTGMCAQIQQVGLAQPEKYLAFLGTLFVFVATSTLCTIIPGFEPPTASLSTTTALALTVFREQRDAVPHGVARRADRRRAQDAAVPRPSDRNCPCRGRRRRRGHRRRAPRRAGRVRS